MGFPLILIKKRLAFIYQKIKHNALQNKWLHTEKKQRYSIGAPAILNL